MSRSRIRLATRLTSSRARRLARSDRGMSTAEYAVGTVAACGFGGVLWKILTSDQVVGLVTDLVRRALSLSF